MEMEIFKNDEFGEIRTLEKDNEVWFVVKDICDILGLTNVSESLKRVDKEDLTSIKLNSGGQNRLMKIVNESGLYSLILTSNKNEAKSFKRWVTSEVLPTIRKHGIYATDNVIENILNNPDYGIKLLEKLKEERQARLEAEHTNKILMHHKKLYTATEIAKELGLSSAKKLNDMLRFKYNHY